VTASPDQSFGPEHAEAQFEATLQRVLRSYHQNEGHGGAQWIGESVLDAVLVPVAREAFLEADDMPSDQDVLRVLDGEDMPLLGEGYHVVALAEHANRFVVKYAKHGEAVPPLAPSPEQPERDDWAHDHGVQPDGRLHPAIWQHIRSFEAYGPLAVPSRVYIAESACTGLNDDQRRALERFRSIGIVRSLGSGPRTLRVDYPDDFPNKKRAPDGVVVAVLVVQPLVTPVAVAMGREIRAGNLAAARNLEARYTQFIHDLWRYGVSHLDFSILNVGITGSGEAERFKIFDPHMGVIEVSNRDREVRDPLPAQGRESIEELLRSARDGTRWALWRIQEDAVASPDVSEERAAGAVEVVREFHTASSGIEQGHGAFSLDRFDRTWRQRGAHGINTVLHAQLWTLSKHPLCGLVHSILTARAPDTVYDRALIVRGMDDERPLGQFRAGLKVYRDRPLVLIANVSDDAPKLVKHWGRLYLPPEVDVQNDPAIHYHLRDLFTGEMYVRSGEDLVRRGLVFGLAPYELHVLQVEDVVVQDPAVERALVAHRDVSEFLKDCTKRMGVVGDVHGELDALKEVLRALGFIDSSDQWFAPEGTLVFTGDVGHGRHLQEVFDFIHRLAAQAHRLGGRIVWTLGNHDLYVDREGGQGGEDSLGYRLWPTIRDAALHPERHPGLIVSAAYFDHGKVFVHAGILPNVVEVALREQGARGAAEIASYVNEVFRRALVERERIAARDLPHEIFRIGTSHARERRLPGEIGYEPAGIFTPDLREVDHYRYHDTLLPQIIGHTASKNGEIRYAPGSWLQRDYIAIDVGRQHGTGNGGLLLTDFGWVAVTPGGPARLVEVGPLFVTLAREGAAGDKWPDEPGQVHVRQMLTAFFRTAKSGRRSRGETQDALMDLSPAQVVALEEFRVSIRQTGRCIVVTDLDEMLTTFSGGDLEHTTIEVLADYLAAGGVLVFNTAARFDWFYYRLLRPLIIELGPRSRVLANVLLVLSGGDDIYVFQDGAYRLVSRSTGRGKAGGFDALVRLSRERRYASVPELDFENVVYIGRSSAPVRIDPAMAHRAGLVINVGDAMLEMPGQPITNLHRGYLRTIALIVAACAALNESGPSKVPEAQPAVGDTVLWTFERKDFPANRRLRVRVRGSGYVHAGRVGADGSWDPVYNVPLIPLTVGGYEAVLPAGVDRFTFFWTETPWTPGHPGHWEPATNGPSTFQAVMSSAGLRPTTTTNSD
jgi:calcineurin-like phosphoesterase family protein